VARRIAANVAKLPVLYASNLYGLFDPEASG